MKKILLFAAVVFCTANTMAQEEEPTLVDITPSGYDWANQAVGTQMNINHCVSGWNTDYTFSYALGGSEYWQNGCISANNASSVDTPKAGTAVVDLGGKIGKVMCINGSASNAQTDLGFTTAASLNSPWQVNIFTDPDNTPKANWLMMEMIVNIYRNTPTAQDKVVANYYMMSGDNDAISAGNTLCSGDFIQYDDEDEPVLDEEENYVYDQNRWARVRQYFWNRSDMAGYGKEGTTSNEIPSKLKIWIPASPMNQCTIFIKSLKFYKCEGWTQDRETAGDTSTPLLHSQIPTITWMTPDDEDWPGEVVTLKGDVNGDGTVDVADVTAILAVMFDSSSTEAAKAKADVNEDSTVDVSDVTATLSIMYE